jgi:hypothetical protein
MADAGDGHHLLGIIDVIKDAVVSHAHAMPSLRALKALDTERAGIVRQALNTRHDAGQEFLRQIVEITPRARGVLDAIGH